MKASIGIFGGLTGLIVARGADRKSFWANPFMGGDTEKQLNERTGQPAALRGRTGNPVKAGSEPADSPGGVAGLRRGAFTRQHSRRSASNSKQQRTK